MNQEHFDQWCAALLSDDYKQGHDYLKSTDTDGVVHHCCLGVGCALDNAIEQVDFHDSDGRRIFHFQSSTTDSADSLPPIEFHVWLGLLPEDHVTEGGQEDIHIDWPDGIVVRGGAGEYGAKESGSDVNTCASLNDAHFTFAQIVDMMRYFGIYSPRAEGAVP